MRYEVTSAPAAEPIALATAKAHVRAIPEDTSEDSAVFAPLIAAARQYCENITGRALARQSLTAYPESWREACLPLPRPPIVSVQSVRYWDADGAEHTLTPATDYVLDAVDGRLFVAFPPTAELRAYAPIEIAYTAGYLTPPEPLRQAMLLLIAHWYVNREAVAVGAVASAEIDLGVRRLCNQYKVWWY